MRLVAIFVLPDGCQKRQRTQEEEDTVLPPYKNIVVVLDMINKLGNRGVGGLRLLLKVVQERHPRPWGWVTMGPLKTDMLVWKVEVLRMLSRFDKTYG